jgi:phosphatidate phosphatase PAH1
MSPDGLISSFKRELIDKTSQHLKISILNEVKNLFPLERLPFIAGFGNRINVK